MPQRYRQPHSEEYKAYVRTRQLTFQDDDVTEKPFYVFQPVIEAHSILIQIDILVLSALKGIVEGLMDVESWYGMDVPDTETPFRTHGGVI